jgi:hypothetical protein
MFNKSMVALASSPLLPESFVAFDWYAFYAPSFFVAVNTYYDKTFQP